MGVMATLDALHLAQERGYDLVEVAPTASPPVTRLLDYGQYKYELAKRDKEAKRKSRSVEFKEIRLKPKIGQGDFDTKVRRAIEFLEEGDRIKVAVQFRGRELTHPHLGRELLEQVRGPGKGSWGPRASAAPRRQVDAHHDRVDPQAEAARGGRRGSIPGGERRGRRGRGCRSGGRGRRCGPGARNHGRVSPACRR